MKPLSLPDSIEADLDLVERIIRTRIHSRSDVANVLGDALTGAENSRYHALLSLLSAQFGRYRIEQVQHVASTAELINTAARVHDTLVDQVARRRGASSLRAPWRQGIPLMVGDYLYALAASEMALVPDPQAIIYFSEAVKAVSEAALTPVTLVAPPEQAEAQYLLHVQGRSAALYQAACQAGSAVCGCTAPQVEALGRYGHTLGLAMQIAADSDAYAVVAVTNGASRTALRRGLITLPLIYAAVHDKQLTSVIDEDNIDPKRMAWAQRLVATYGVPPARATARRLRDEALAELAPFAVHPSYQLLVAVTTQLVA